MDMSTNMIAVLSTGSGMNAQTSDSIVNLAGSGGLDFQSLLMGMMNDTGSPVSEAFNANSLLTSNLYEGMPQLFPMGNIAESLPDVVIQTAQTDSDEEQKEIPFLQAAELTQLMQSAKPEQGAKEAQNVQPVQNSIAVEAAPDVKKVSTAVQTSQPAESVKTVELEVETERPKPLERAEKILSENMKENTGFIEGTQGLKVEKTTSGANQVNTIGKLRNVQGVQETQQMAFTPNADEAVSSQTIKSETVKTDQPIKPELKPETAGTFERTVIDSTISTKLNEAKTADTMMPESKVSEVNNSSVLERVVPAKTQTTDEQQNFVDVSAKHLQATLQSSEMAAETSKTQQSSSTTQSGPAYMQVAKGVETAVASGKEEFTMQLKPEGLGEISVKLIKEGAKVTISIAAENPETHSLLLNQVDGLIRNLKLSHINVEGVQVQNVTTTGQDTPVSATNAYDFNSSVDVNKEGAQRENHGSNQSHSAHQFFANEQEASDETDETLQMLRTQMRMMDYLA